MFSEGGYSNVALIVYPSVKTLSMISECPMVLLATSAPSEVSPWDMYCGQIQEMWKFFLGKKHGCYKKTNLRGNSDI